MYKYLVTFMWNIKGNITIKSVNVALPFKIGVLTTEEDILKHIDAFEMIPKHDSKIIAFSLYAE